MMFDNSKGSAIIIGSMGSGKGKIRRVRSAGTQLAASDPTSSGISIEDLHAALISAWGNDTSADENWDISNRSLGQCAVSALVVQDHFAGELLRTTVGGVSHYLNRLPGGEKVDLTLDQFGPGATYDDEPVVRERTYVEGHEATMARYQTLRDRLAQ